jgi:hypothetical protein
MKNKTTHVPRQNKTVRATKKKTSSLTRYFKGFAYTGIEVSGSIAQINDSAQGFGNPALSDRIQLSGAARKRQSRKRNSTARFPRERSLPVSITDSWEP